MTTLIIIGGDIDAPMDPVKNTEFHQAILDRLAADARDAGWAGAEICGYDRFDGRVACNVIEGQGWPNLLTLRAWRAANPDADQLLSRPETTVQPDEFGQGSMF